LSRALLLEILAAGLAAVDGKGCMVRAARAGKCGRGAFNLIAIGKSACEMSNGLLQVRGQSLGRGLLITRRGYADPALGRDPRIRLLESGHPLPDQSSVDAGAMLLAFLQSLDIESEVVVLVSGGASSLVEVPAPGVCLEDLRRANRWLLSSGLDIRSINAVRRRLSQIKDGGLARALNRRRVTACYLSDVAGDDPADIGSGLLKRTTAALPGGLPAWLRALLAPDDVDPSAGAEVTHNIVAGLSQALAACADAASATGARVCSHTELLDGEPEAAADLIVSALESGPAGIHLWGGETTPRLPEQVGRGGRNQHLALCCAIRIAGHDRLTVLCSATDGSDGNTSDAGGLVDSASVARGAAMGLDAARCLADADAGTFLEASGDLISTGPTGTNVTDLVIGLKA
jgi:hydroxypyruvate reductase